MSFSASVGLRPIGEGLMSGRRDVVDCREFSGEVGASDGRGNYAGGGGRAHSSAFDGSGGWLPWGGWLQRLVGG